MILGSTYFAFTYNRVFASIRSSWLPSNLCHKSFLLSGNDAYVEWFIIYFLDWHMGMKVPPSIYWIYVCEAGFYIHGIYGTMFMDIWRDDSVMLIIHHILTISLVVFSLGLR